MKRYLVIGGPIVSAHDGDIHYIGCGKLMSLYGVPPHECVTAEVNQGKTLVERALKLYPDLVVLRPRYDGNYTIPEV